MLIKLLVIPLTANPESAAKNPNEQNSSIFKYQVADFSSQSYKQAVITLIQNWERTNGHNIQPGLFKKVGLKVYTRSGPGLATPKALVNAVADFLISRGYERSNIFIVDEYERYLRSSEFLPPLSQSGNSFEGIPVYSLDSGRFWDKKWFYESSLPSREKALFSSRGLSFGGANTDDDRKSYLPTLLFLNTDFWINLPMAISMESIGVGAAVANASILNISNNTRFFSNQAQASVAASEILAIPELKEKMIFTILTLESYQFIGESRFNANYTQSEPLVLLSDNPGAIDYLMLKRINQLRFDNKLPIIETLPAFFDYLTALGFAPYTGPCVKEITANSSH